jgi:hypothetical protein
MKARNISKYFFKILISGAFFCFLATPKNLNAQENQPLPPVEIKASVDKPVATVGDLIRFKIELQTEKDIHPQEPTPLKPKEGLIYIKRETPEIRLENDRNTAIFHYIFRADLVGRFAIPSIKIKFLAPYSKTPGSPIEGSITSPETFVEVHSVLQTKEGPPALQDIKSLIEVERSWIHYWPYALAAILFILLIYYFVKKQRRKLVKPQLKSPQLIPCHVLALKELEALQKKDLLVQDSVREYYFELSEIFRKYLGARYLFPALDRTRQEIYSCLKKNVEIDNHLKIETEFILEQTDRVKFAKVAPSIHESDEIMKSVTEFVKSTIPIVQEKPQVIAAPVKK